MSRKSWEGLGSTVPRARVTVPTRTTTEDATDAVPLAPTQGLRIGRIWICTDYRGGCTGRSPFLGWSQLIEDRPSCPHCGADMFWHQYATRQSPRRPS